MKENTDYRSEAKKIKNNKQELINEDNSSFETFRTVAFWEGLGIRDYLRD